MVSKENFRGLEGRVWWCNLMGFVGVKWEEEDAKPVEG